MATRLYSIQKNQHETQIVEAVGSATTTASIELTVDLVTNTPNKEEVIRALKELQNYLIKSNWPPA